MQTMLFTPAVQPERAKKAWEYSPGAVILDLEDTVPETQKDNARSNARQVIASDNKNWYVRINSLQSSKWKTDIQTVLHENLKGVLVPKIEYKEEIQELIEEINDENLRINVTVETVKGLMNIRSILEVSKQITSVTFGEGDFSLDMGIEWDSFSPLLRYAKCKMAFESRLAGIEKPHDGVYPNLSDENGLYESAKQSKDLGFGCKHCIHPSQIPIVKRVFSPTEREIRNAEEIVEKFEEAIKHGMASITVGNQFVDYPVYYRALQILDAK